MSQKVLMYSAQTAAEYLFNGFIGGFTRGRAEAGPRALGNRSILADARSVTNKDRINGFIKNRMAFQPLAPLCLDEDFDKYFERLSCDISLDYMLFAVKCKPLAEQTVPAIIHADQTARVQLINKENYPHLYELLIEFKKLSGIGILINTSFNGKGEPIVNTPDQAYAAYKTLDLDFLVLDKYFITERL
ncbi:hypothetical protein JMN32_05530 [Fulvivirga sp. 29W222]|uniref:Carbamoyltransferase C-terminal domain-containing protein n=1 Tax=Fulvivirga marina TaxID=2494733 RepID=A0A937KBC4_9BACT|nr:carbamoyltransferase C-terminal domain-containing protein [Fulvivirga marina]MBL6445759.1 hypothetical protein [Fulvivirga marina]